MEFKDRLKRLRQEKQISQQALADAIFVSRSAIAKWENGLGIPSDDSYRALLEYFGVTDEELPLMNDIEEIVIPKNRKIHKLSAAIVIISILFACLLTVIVVTSRLSPVGRIKSYNWEKVDALLADIGKEDISYFLDGSVGNRGDMIEIYYNKDADAETFIRLKKIYRYNDDDYYYLMFDKHYYNMVEGKIVTVGYSCSFHYEGDVAYNLELADVDYFIGDVETVESLRECTTYQVNNKEIKKGQFISCILEPISSFGNNIDSEFHLPGGDENHIFELMKFGFEKTTEFFKSHNLSLPY